jgi:apolipoprotein N-acyltransferase
MDNDFNGVPTFPPFHAADAVFRAAENHLAFGLGTVNGVSMVIDPYGRITAAGKVNERGVTVGETFVVNSQTLYNSFRRLVRLDHGRHAGRAYRVCHFQEKITGD